MKPASVHFIAAVFVLATAFTSAQGDARRPKPPASMAPADLFSSTAPTSSETTAHTNVTTHKTTTHKTTTPKVTTAPPTTPKVTTAPPTTPNVTTAPPTTPNVTTAAPTTHNATTANVTTAPPTTHNTTTANVTTVPPTTHNTTTANITTATTATPPTPKPTQPTNITVGNYTVKDGNKLCIMVQAAIQVQVNNSQMVGTYIVPGSADSTGKCESNTASLMITLKEGYVSMNFAKNDTTKMVFVNAVAVNLTYAFKSGVLSHLVKKNESVQLFSMTASHSYSCKSESVFLGNGIYLMFSQDRMQAFNFTNNQFGPIDLCKADQPDYRVAIGVGVVLLILIVIVVIAYLISRRKRTDGYQTL
ncbi:macrosialin isoform X1 [Silurus meridionalis]|uniref:macrosialin isoform X1 n=1 Tax=Silurus meridionalis TaxID=175797 RepID=UPI001EEB8191|nr:macrosialin isoform X1 [Silurus meridionalis]